MKILPLNTWEHHFVFNITPTITFNTHIFHNLKLIPYKLKPIELIFKIQQYFDNEANYQKIIFLLVRFCNLTNRTDVHRGDEHLSHDFIMAYARQRIRVEAKVRNAHNTIELFTTKHDGQWRYHENDFDFLFIHAPIEEINGHWAKFLFIPMTLLKAQRLVVREGIQTARNPNLSYQRYKRQYEYNLNYAMDVERIQHLIVEKGSICKAMNS